VTVAVSAEEVDIMASEFAAVAVVLAAVVVV
jgi:hypothetical protein